MSGGNCFGFIKSDKKSVKEVFIEFKWISFYVNLFMLICNIDNNGQIQIGTGTWMRYYRDMNPTLPMRYISLTFHYFIEEDIRQFKKILYPLLKTNQ